MSILVKQLYAQLWVRLNVLAKINPVIAVSWSAI